MRCLTRARECARTVEREGAWPRPQEYKSGGVALRSFISLRAFFAVISTFSYRHRFLLVLSTMNVWLAVFAAIFAVSVSIPIDPFPDWENFKIIYNKRYENSTVELFRKGIYLENKRKYEEHNANSKGPCHKILEISRYDDWTNQEKHNYWSKLHENRPPKLTECIS